MRRRPAPAASSEQYLATWGDEPRELRCEVGRKPTRDPSGAPVFEVTYVEGDRENPRTRDGDLQLLEIRIS